jgi:uncharacterized membrane protein
VYRPDTLTNVLLVLHILAVIVALAPGIVSPLFAQHIAGEDPTIRTKVAGYLYKNGQRVHAPALIVVGLLGFGLVASEEDLGVKWEHGWVQAAITVWIVMNGLVHGMILPGERKVANGDDSGERRAAIGGMIVDLLAIVMLYLMVFKPGR